MTLSRAINENRALARKNNRLIDDLGGVELSTMLETLESLERVLFGIDGQGGLQKTIHDLGLAVHALQVLNEVLPTASSFSVQWLTPNVSREYLLGTTHASSFYPSLRVDRGVWDRVSQPLVPLGQIIETRIIDNYGSRLPIVKSNHSINTRIITIATTQPFGSIALNTNALSTVEIFTNTLNSVSFADGPIPVSNLGNPVESAWLTSRTLRPSNNFTISTYTIVRLNPGGIANDAEPSDQSGEPATERLFLSTPYVIVPLHQYEQDIVIDGREPISVYQWFTDPSDPSFLELDEDDDWSKSQNGHIWTINFSNHGFIREPVDIRVDF